MSKFYVKPSNVIDGIRDWNPDEIVVIGRRAGDPEIYLAGSHGDVKKLMKKAKKYWLI